MQKDFRSMKCSWHLSLIIVGVFLLFVGFWYDVMFAGIPYPDPTPEQAASYAYHGHLASLMEEVGSGVFLIGSIAGIVRLAIRVFRA